jgi:putative ABC transport system permease protein
MFRVAIKGLLGHKLRFLLTTLAVVLGVTFVAGAFVLTDTMEGAFDDLFETSYATADVYVRGGTSFDVSAAEFEAGSGPTLDQDLVADIQQVDGVEEAVPGVEGTARFLDPDGDPIQTQAPALGFAWSDAANPLTLREGREPRENGEVTMDVTTFERFDFAIGDEVQVAGPSGVETFTLVGATGFGDSDNLLGATIATWTLEDTQRLFDKEGQVDEIAVVGDGSLDPAALAEEVAASLQTAGAEAEVSTATDRAASESADVADAVGFLTTALLAFAGIALFVGMFLIANTFSIIVAQRAREFALLRAVGASARQVRTAVLAESLLVGIVASTIGLCSASVWPCSCRRCSKPGACRCRQATRSSRLAPSSSLTWSASSSRCSPRSCRPDGPAVWRRSRRCVAPPRRRPRRSGAGPSAGRCSPSWVARCCSSA